MTTSGTQRLTGAATAVMGLNAGAAAQSADVNLCFQADTGGNLTSFNLIGYVTPRFADERRTYSATSSHAPGAGTWKVGMCVRNQGTAAISNNDWVQGWVMVT